MQSVSVFLKFVHLYLLLYLMCYLYLLMFWAVIFVIYSVWWQFLRLEFLPDTIHDTAPLTSRWKSHWSKYLYRFRYTFDYCYWQVTFFSVVNKWLYCGYRAMFRKQRCRSMALPTCTIIERALHQSVTREFTSGPSRFKRWMALSTG